MISCDIVRVLTVVVEMWDTLGSSVASRGTRFGARAVLSRRNKIDIRSFEVVNTIVQGCNLKESLTKVEMKVLGDFEFRRCPAFGFDQSQGGHEHCCSCQEAQAEDFCRGVVR